MQMVKCCSNRTLEGWKHDFVVRSLRSTMVFDRSKPFSFGVGYKQFGTENYLLGGLRFSNAQLLDIKFAGYFNVIVPIKYLYDGDFFDGWWTKIWLDAWLYFSF